MDKKFFKNDLSLHDSILNQILITENGIKLIFNNGIYKTDSNGIQTELTNKCCMNIKINEFDSKNLFQHIEIYKIYKKKVTEINYQELSNLLNVYYFDIDDEFYSQFSKSLLLVGFIEKIKIIFKISEIENTSFEY